MTTLRSIPLEYAPQGLSRPWYPIFVTTVIPEVGDHVVFITYTADSTVTKKRVGLRRWFRHIRHADPKFKDA